MQQTTSGNAIFWFLNSRRIPRIFRSCCQALAFALTLAAPQTAIGQSDRADAQEIRQPQTVTLADLAEYVKNFDRGWARFNQLNADGSSSSGIMLFGRPARLRIEYDPPNSGLVIADSFRVAVFDQKSNTAPVVYPLSATPLYYLLKTDINLLDPSHLIDYRIGTAASEIALRGPGSDSDGYVTLTFTHQPIRLAGWIYTDDLGQKTRMLFEQIGFEIDITPDLFSIESEIKKRNLK